MSILIDKRKARDFIDAVRKLAPYYTPEWRFNPDDPDPGSALFFLVADMLEENIKRLNRAPDKHLAAFLNMLDVRLLSARPSYAYITFHLTGQVPEPVWIPQGTGLSAPAADGGDELQFETEQPLLVTSAELVTAYNVSVPLDQIVLFPVHNSEQPQPSDGLSPAYPVLFGTSKLDNVQEHILYIGHSFMFNLTHETRIELEWIHEAKHYLESEACELLARSDYAEWSYYSEGEWVVFREVVQNGNRITLYKDEVRPATLHEIMGTETFWLRCRIVDQLDERVQYNDRIELNGLYVQTEYIGPRTRGGIAPDRVYFNDMELLKRDFYPFGEIFAPYGTFYIGCNEVLSKREGWVTLRFHLDFALHELAQEQPEQINWKMIMKRSEFEKPKPPPIMIRKVIWEYWNGSGWIRLLDDEETESLFSYAEEGERRIQFRCPPDMTASSVNAEDNYWIRARIVSVENLYSGSMFYMSPLIKSIGLSYDYGDVRYPLEQCITYNNLEYKDRTNQTRPGSEPFKPFYSFDNTSPSAYFGFSAAPLKGPISLYISLQEQKISSDRIPVIDWEYFAKDNGVPRWLPLKVIDGTEGFTRSGIVQFHGPPNFLADVKFGVELYWIRIVNSDRKYERKELPFPRVKGMYLNTVKAVQFETIRDETPEEAVYPDEGFILSRKPVLSEEVWVNESGHLTEAEIESMQEADQDGIIVLRDSEGLVMRVWVRWQSVDHFEFSGPKDRHYTLDRLSGRLRFGNQVNGKALPHRGADHVKVHYRVGGGSRGNVPEHTITDIAASIAYIDSATNHEPAGGGCEMELLEEAIRRGPQVLRHQNRAVTVEDFEWLAKTSHPNLAKVKCLANRNIELEYEQGAVTVITLPKHIGDPMQFLETRQQVEAYLYDRIPVTLAFPGKIRVIEPAYVEIGVHATLAVERMDDIIPVEREAVLRLEQFLHPLTGNYNGHGWEIGQTLHDSVFYALLKSIRAVKFVDRLYISVILRENGMREEISIQKWGQLPHGVIVSGKHHIQSIVK